MIAAAVLATIADGLLVSDPGGRVLRPFSPQLSPRVVDYRTGGSLSPVLKQCGGNCVMFGQIGLLDTALFMHRQRQRHDVSLRNLSAHKLFGSAASSQLANAEALSIREWMGRCPWQVARLPPHSGSEVKYSIRYGLSADRDYPYAYSDSKADNTSIIYNQTALCLRDSKASPNPDLLPNMPKAGCGPEWALLHGARHDVCSCCKTSTAQCPDPVPLSDNKRFLRAGELSGYQFDANVHKVHPSGAYNETQVAESVAKAGPVGVAVSACEWGSIKNNATNPISKCGLPEKCGHYLMIVGYNADGVRDSSGKQVGPAYWILKNSWGRNWGQEGYGFLEMGSSCTWGAGSFLHNGVARMIMNNTYDREFAGEDATSALGHRFPS